jgi:hypothetical protein
MPKSSKQGIESRHNVHPEDHAAHDAPTGVQPVEPADEQPTPPGKDHQRQALKLNVEGSAGQAQRHPDTPAGQHATGSFTGENDAALEKTAAKPRAAGKVPPRK